MYTYLLDVPLCTYVCMYVCTYMCMYVRMCVSFPYQMYELYTSHGNNISHTSQKHSWLMLRKMQKQGQPTKEKERQLLKGTREKPMKPSGLKIMRRHWTSITR